MDTKTFDMIDGILTTKGFREDRQAAVDILEVGVREGTLVDVAEVIARRYAPRLSSNGLLKSLTGE